MGYKEKSDKQTKAGYKNKRVVGVRSAWKIDIKYRKQKPQKNKNDEDYS